MHNINKMVWTGAPPWHGLGTELPANASYERIVEAAGFYEARERDLVVAPDGQTVPDRKAIVRGDDGRYLAVVGRGYEIVQFSEVARTLVEAAGGTQCIFHTAGTLGPVGVRGWLLGELPEPIVVRGDPSPIRKYILGTAGHDGTTAVVIKNVATRVVCQNTLGVALGERLGAEWRIHHTTNAKWRLDQAGRAFAEVVRSYSRLGDLANVMARTPFTDAQMRTTVDRVMPIPEDDRDHSRLLVERDRVLSLFEVGIGLGPEIKGTAWAAFQGWSEYLDHHRPQRFSGRGSLAAVRLESIWMGTAAAKKVTALNAILQESRIPLAA